METSDLFKLILLVLGYFLSLGVIFYVIWKRGSNLAKRAEYERKYSEVKEMVSGYPVVPGNYELIKKELEALEALKHKESETTSVLRTEFFRKFKVDADADRKRYLMKHIEKTKKVRV